MAPPAVSAPRQPDMFVVRRGLNIGNSGCFFSKFAAACCVHAKHDLARSRRVSHSESTQFSSHSVSAAAIWSAVLSRTYPLES